MLRSMATITKHHAHADGRVDDHVGRFGVHDLYGLFLQAEQGG